MKKSAIRTAAALCGLLVGCGGDQAPGTPVEFAIGDHEIRLTRVVQHLKAEDESVSLFGIGDLIRVDEGFLVSDARNNRLVVLGPDLVFVREIGTSGDGPGEYRMPTAVERLGDDIVVMDEGVGRINFLDARGAFREARSVSGNASDVALHGDLGPLIVSGLFDGFYLARESGDGPEPFGAVPLELQTERRGVLAVRGDLVAVTPDGAVHVLDQEELVLVSYDPDGEVVAVRPLPRRFREQKKQYRDRLIDDFGGPGRVFGVTVASQLEAMPDGRLLVLSAFENAIGFALDLESNHAFPVVNPGTVGLEWLAGGSSALFDGTRLVIGTLSEIAIVETELVAAISR